MTTYLTVACNVSVHITHDTAPNMKSSVKDGVTAAIAFITYRGEVPMSPKAMPIATRIPAAVSLFFIFFCYDWLIQQMKNPYSLSRVSLCPEFPNRYILTLPISKSNRYSQSSSGLTDIQKDDGVQLRESAARSRLWRQCAVYWQSSRCFH